ncbi:hypothetical protein DPMN_056406 [Dreissena polymorpha]|uniref:Uncharacterized protein n=1 Tax=Dreissena polymorpha TaxID=45954 RepID=A0A9D4HTK6_DREPO|nr:hypothetical protein DPMN_056406 [Dreissena polymorpha]
MWDNFLVQNNYSGNGGIRTRDLSISKPGSTITPLFPLIRRLHNFTVASVGLRVLSLMQSVRSHWPISNVYNHAPPSVAKAD